MADTDFELTVTFSVDGSERVFNNLEELKEFLQFEVDFWTWISKVNNSLFGQLHSLYPAQLTSVIITIDQYATDKNPNRLVAIQQETRSIFAQKKLPPSSSKLGQFINTVAEADKDVAAAMLSSAMELPINNATHWSVLKGRTLLALHESPFLDIDYKAAAKSLSKLSLVHTEEIKKFKRQQKQAEKVADEQLETDRHRVTQLLADSETAWTSLKEEISDALGSFKTVESQYREFMGLKAPVEYWTKKAEKHKAGSEQNLERLTSFAVIGGLILTAFLGIMAAIAWNLATSNPPLPVYLTLVTISLAVTTGVIWATRVFVRNYLSEQHLYIDAEERATMIQTHLALIEGGQNDPDERKILLQAIFRPTADGMVKDDAAPSFPGANILNGGGN